MKDKNHRFSRPQIPTLVKTSFAAACLLFGAHLGQAQTTPAISSIYPDGAHQFEPSATLTFTVTSTAGVNPTNISVQLTATSLPGQTFLKSLNSANGLSINGPSTSETVSAFLNSNETYSVLIQVTDTAGHSASTNLTFDTINPIYTFEAEDFDYNSGHFFDIPQTNAYAGLTGVAGVDCQHNGQGNSNYRPNPLETEPASDKPRLAYQGAGNTNIDYDVGFNNGGDWGNYTRHYPPGTYNVYGRLSDGNGAQSDAASLSVVAGTPSLVGTAPFSFSVPSSGWQTFTWCPLKDANGNLAQLVTDGTQGTLQVATVGGNYNANFYLLVLADTNPPIFTITVANAYPNGANLFQPSTNFSFTASSTNGIDPSDISIQLTASNLWGGGYISNLANLSGLTVTGPSTNVTVSAALQSNSYYTAFIEITDNSGNPQSFTYTFDTITPTYTFEAEDYDYTDGGFFDNPQTNAYSGYDATQGIDFSCLNNVHSYAYRGDPETDFGLNTEQNGDVPRAAYDNTGFIDYDVGFTAGGNWGNYTRNYPPGTYNVYIRASDGGGNTSDSASMSLLTSGYGTSSQSVTKLGTFSIAATGGWQTYSWTPLIDAGGNLARVNGGSMETFRETTDNGNYNANFYLLIPADPSVKELPYVTSFAPDGTALFQATNQLSFTANSSAGLAQNNVVLSLNGVVVSNLGFSGSATAWNVTYPVQSNSYYTAIITLTDNNGSTWATNSFGTFSSSNYTWEAEDYDYGGGHYYDNPQVDQYNGLASISGVDNLQSDASGNPFDYRPSPGPSTTPSGDLPRDQYTSSGAVDYNIGFFGGGSWANYTRQYLPGTYVVWGRFAEGGAATEATLSQVTSGQGTATQTVNPLGTFFIPLGGWSSWGWAPLENAKGGLAKVNLTGGPETLQFGGTPVAGQPEVNVNFFMLVPTAPTPTLTASMSGNSVTISFLTETGYSYQVEYKNNLTDAAWTLLGNAVTGNNATGSVSDTVSGSHRFYQVQVH